MSDGSQRGTQPINWDRLTLAEYVEPSWHLRRQLRALVDWRTRRAYERDLVLRYLAQCRAVTLGTYVESPVREKVRRLGWLMDRWVLRQITRGLVPLPRPTVGSGGRHASA